MVLTTQRKKMIRLFALVILVGIVHLLCGCSRYRLWALVEGNVHYPSYVLAAMALGHFVAAFINDAFMGLNDSAAGSMALSPGSATIRFWRAF